MSHWLTSLPSSCLTAGPPWILFRARRRANCSPTPRACPTASRTRRSPRGCARTRAGGGSVEVESNEVTAGADTELLVGVAQVELHGSPAQEQLSGHVGVGVPAADQGGDLLLLRGQPERGRGIAFPSGLAGGAQFLAGALGPRLCADFGENVECGS